MNKALIDQLTRQDATTLERTAAQAIRRMEEINNKLVIAEVVPMKGVPKGKELRWVGDGLVSLPVGAKLYVKS